MLPPPRLTGRLPACEPLRLRGIVAVRGSAAAARRSSAPLVMSEAIRAVRIFAVAAWYFSVASSCFMFLYILMPAPPVPATAPSMSHTRFVSFSMHASMFLPGSRHTAGPTHMVSAW